MKDPPFPHGRSNRDREKRPGVASGRIVNGVEVWWKEAFKEFDAKYFHVGWAAHSGHYGIAKVLLMQVGSKQAEVVIRTCVSNWTSFREFARSGSTLHIPEQPDLLSLSAHAGAAVQYALKQTKMEKTAGIGGIKAHEFFKAYKK